MPSTPSHSYWFAFNTWTSFDASWLKLQADNHHKPLMICESTRRYSATSFSSWINDFFSDLGTYGIKGYQYINWNWDTYANYSSSWDDGQYTSAGQTVVDLFNSKTSATGFLNRDSSYYDPIQLAVSATRGATGQSSVTNTSWSKSNDEYSAKSGYDYTVISGLHDYLTSFTTRWINQPGTNELSVDITVPANSSGYIYLVGRGTQFAHDVWVGSTQVLSGINVLDKKLSYSASDISNGKVRVKMVTKEEDVIGIQTVVVQSLSSAAPAAPTNLAVVPWSSHADLSWTAVSGAEMYNIYCNGQLIGTSQTNAFTDDESSFSSTRTYTVSACDDHEGEGLMSSSVTLDACKLEAEQCDDHANLTISGGTLNFIQNGAWAKYSDIDFGNLGVVKVGLYASSANGGTVEIHLDQPTGLLLGTVTIPAGSWSAYNMQTAAITGVTGKQDLYLVFKTTSGGYVCNLDRFEFTKANDPYLTIPAITADGYSNLTVGSSTLSFVHSGAWAKYSHVNFGSAGAINLETYASSLNGGTIEARLDSPTGTLVGSVTVPAGSWTTYTIRTGAIAGATGFHDVYLVFTGNGTYVCNLQWLRFVELVTASPYGSISAINADQTSNLSKNSLVLYSVQNGGWAQYRDLDFGSLGALTWDVVASSGNTGGGTIEAHLDSTTGTLIGSATIPYGAWTTYSTVETNVTGVTGIHDLFLVFNSASGYAPNLKRFSFIGRDGRNPYLLNSAVPVDAYSALDASGSVLAYISNGAWAKYKEVDFRDVGSAILSISASSLNGGTIEARLDSPTGTLMGSVAVRAGSWSTYHLETATISAARGIHDFYLVFRSTGGYVCNVQSFQLTEIP